MENFDIYHQWMIAPEKDLFRLYSTSRYVELLKAAELIPDSIVAEAILERCYRMGLGVPKDFAKADGILAELLPKLKKLQRDDPDNCWVLDRLGVLYDDKSLPCHDAYEAFVLFDRAASSGYVSALRNLGGVYDAGLGVEQDWAKAFECYRKAAEHGFARAQYSLGLMYEFGRGVLEDEEKAIELYRKAAEQGDTNALFALAAKYATGSGVKKDYVIAGELYRKAAEQRHPRALYNLGAMYEHGLGFEKDEAKAVEWYRKAADMGHAKAKERLVVNDVDEILHAKRSVFDEVLRHAVEQGYLKDSAPSVNEALSEEAVDISKRVWHALLRSESKHSDDWTYWALHRLGMQLSIYAGIGAALGVKRYGEAFRRFGIWNALIEERGIRGLDDGVIDGILGGDGKYEEECGEQVKAVFRDCAQCGIITLLGDCEDENDCHIDGDEFLVGCSDCYLFGMHYALSTGLENGWNGARREVIDDG